MANESFDQVIRVRPTLTLIPCNHFWLEVRTMNGEVTAVCKHKGCKKKEVFSLQQWSELAHAGRCLNKPIRV